MTEFALPTTRYAHSGEVSIAYQCKDKLRLRSALKTLL
jgi:hypothetical protein